MTPQVAGLELREGILSKVTMTVVALRSFRSNLPLHANFGLIPGSRHAEFAIRL